MWIEHLAEKGTPSEPNIKGREEEPAEAQGGKMPAPADDYTLPRCPIGGSQPSGFDCRTGPPHESCNTKVVISKMLEEMQEGFKRIEDDMDTKIQKSVAAALAQFGFCPQTNARTVSPSGPHHNPLGNNGRTNAAAGSSGGPIAQSSPQNEENAGTNENLYGDRFPNLSDPGPEMVIGNLADIVGDHCMQPSTTWTTPLTMGAINSTVTGAMGISFERAEELKRKGEEELDGNHRSKRPIAAYNNPSRPPNGVFMAEAPQNYRQLAAAPAIQGSLFSTNEGTQIQMTAAAHDEEASTSSQAPPQVAWGMWTNDGPGQGSIEGLSWDDPLPDVAVDSSAWDTFLNSLLDLEMLTGNLAGYSNVALGATNFTTIGGEPHHDLLGVQGEIAVFS